MPPCIVIFSTVASRLWLRPPKTDAAVIIFGHLARGHIPMRRRQRRRGCFTVGLEGARKLAKACSLPKIAGTGSPARPSCGVHEIEPIILGKDFHTEFLCFLKLRTSAWASDEIERVFRDGPRDFGTEAFGLGFGLFARQTL